MSHKLYPTWRDQVVYAPDGPKPKILAESENFKVVLAGLEPGQKIPQHPEALATYYFLEGTGWMIVDDERIFAKPGAIVVTPAGARRGIEAETRLAFLAARGV